MPNVFSHIIHNELVDILDVKQRLNDFNARFNTILRNFKNVSLETLLYLFDAFCLPDYGLCLWDVGHIFNKQMFKIFNTSYSNSLKRMLNVPLGSSSHATAEVCNHFLLNHQVVLIQARYMKRVFSSRNSIIRLNLPFIKSGYIYTSLLKLFQDKYNTDICFNDLDILKSRISWVQRNEERRAMYDFYGI